MHLFDVFHNGLALSYVWHFCAGYRKPSPRPGPCSNEPIASNPASQPGTAGSYPNTEFSDLLWSMLHHCDLNQLPLIGGAAVGYLEIVDARRALMLV